MKKTLIALCAIALTATMVRAEEPVMMTEPAPEKEWSVEIGLDAYSEYIFRGFDVTGNTEMYSPSIVGSWKGFSAAFYGYYSPVDVPGLDWYTEHDYSLDYTFEYEIVSVTGGFVYYQYPESASGTDTWEVYLSVGFDVPLSPSITYYYDLDAFETHYLSFSIGHDFDLTESLGLKDGMSLTVSPSAALGIGDLVNSGIELNDLLLGVSASLGLNETVSIHAGVQVSIALDALDDAGQGDEIIGNVGITFAF